MSKDNAGAPSKALAESSQPAAPAAAAPSSESAKVGAAQMRTERARASDSAQLPVPEWIALIRRLRSEGKVVEAAKELAAFRAAHVDHEKLLPRDLTDWRPLP